MEYGVTFDSSGTATEVKIFKDMIVYDQYLIASIMFNSLWISSNYGSEWVSFNEGLISDWSFSGLAINDPYLWSLRESFGNAYRRPLIDLVTGINTEEVTLPYDYALSQNYPNPFNPTTKIKFTIPGNVILSGAKNLVILKVYDVVGNEIATLVNEEMPAGEYEVEFNPASSIRYPASGFYFYQLRSGSIIETKKMVLLK